MKKIPMIHNYTCKSEWKRFTKKFKTPLETNETSTSAATLGVFLSND